MKTHDVPDSSTPKAHHNRTATKQHDSDHAKNAFAVSGTSPTPETGQSAPATPTPDTTPPVQRSTAQRPTTPQAPNAQAAQNSEAKLLLLEDAPGGNYVRKLARLVEKHPELRGRASAVIIRHDDWCAIYSGRPCNCDPDVEVPNGNN